MNNLKGILSTTVLPLDGQYKVVELKTLPDITGVPHYIGHPDTRAIVEALGAVKADSNLFPGLAVGESCLCFSIKQGMSTRKDDGFTSPHQDVDMSMLTVRKITRVSDCFC
jgi:hypothetical protein